MASDISRGFAGVVHSTGCGSVASPFWRAVVDLELGGRESDDVAPCSGVPVAMRCGGRRGGPHSVGRAEAWRVITRSSFGWPCRSLASDHEEGGRAKLALP